MGVPFPRDLFRTTLMLYETMEVIACESGFILASINVIVMLRMTMLSRPLRGRCVRVRAIPIRFSGSELASTERGGFWNISRLRMSLMDGLSSMRCW